MSQLFAKPTVFPVVDSTNRYLVDAAKAGAPEGTVIVADEQTAGRGRRGRSWVSPPRSALLCSMLFRPKLNLHDAHLIPIIVSLGLHRCIEQLTEAKPELKWPNDLLLKGKKVAGVLSEIVVDDAGYSIVVGLGVNLRWPEGFFTASEEPFLAELSERATTIEEVTKYPVDRNDLLTSLLSYCASDYLSLVDRGARGRVMARYRAACSTIGRRVSVETTESVYEADATGVTDEGRLIVRVEEVEHELDAADVVHLRSTSRAGNLSSD